MEKLRKGLNISGHHQRLFYTDRPPKIPSLLCVSEMINCTSGYLSSFITRLVSFMDFSVRLYCFKCRLSTLFHNFGYHHPLHWFQNVSTEKPILNVSLNFLTTYFFMVHYINNSIRTFWCYILLFFLLCFSK